MMPRPLIFLSCMCAATCGFTASAQDESPKPRIGEQVVAGDKEPEKSEPVSADKAKLRRTTVFDATEIRKLYKDAKTQNDKLSESLPAHLNGEELDLVTLKALDVGGTDLKLQRDLVERLDPKPRRRLERIAEIDPEAAYEMMVTTRNDHEFMSGQYDRRTTAGDPGRPANFTGGQLGKAFEKAVELLRGKKDEPVESEPAK